MARKKKTDLMRVPDKFKKHVKKLSKEKNENMTEIVKRMDRLIRDIEKKDDSDPLALKF